MASFPNRREAGRRLGDAVARLQLTDPVVLALPRGGVPVAVEVAHRLGAPLDILLVRKIGAPGHEEYGIGAVVEGNKPEVVIDERIARAVGADQAYIDRVVARELAEIERRRAVYRLAAPLPLKGRAVVLVDDGIATGATVRAALKGLATAGAARIILAVPIAPADTLAELRGQCDKVVCLMVPEPFWAVGAHYGDFAQTRDAEVSELLAANRAGKRQPSAGA